MMSKDVSIVDIVVHLHPESSPDEKDKIENELRAHDGVVSVHYSEEDHPHAMCAHCRSTEIAGTLKTPQIYDNHA
jgi:cytosine/adenosine deaminase-related metal-dependent hydrolase